MKKAFYLLVLVVTLLMISGCVLLHKEGASPYYHGNRYDLFRLALNSFPGPRFGLGVTIKNASIEKDSYGRELYVVRMDHAKGFYGEGINAAYVISQAHDDEEKRIYYYEDICFKLFIFDKGLDDVLLKELKEDNDWNQPINMDKCSSRSFANDFAGMDNLSFNYSAYVSIEKAFGEDIKDSICPITMDVLGKELYSVMVEKNGERKSYLVIYHPGQRISIESNCLELTNIDDVLGNELHQFKIRNEWVFFDCP